MPQVKFNLKDKKSQKPTLIYLIFNYNNQRIKLSTSYSVPPKFWNDRKQEVKENVEFKQYARINHQLRTLKQRMEDLYDYYRFEQGYIPDANTLKSEFLSKGDDPIRKTVQKSFWGYFEDFIKYKKRQLKDIRDYDKSLRKHLKKGEEKFGRPITFKNLMNQVGGFVENWDEYLTYEAINSNGEPGLTINTIGKQHKNLKVFLNWCFENGFTNQFSLKHLPTVSEEIDSVYLTEDELDDLLKLKLKDQDEESVRDLFILGCETGLRFSDYSRLQKEMIIEGILNIKTRKDQKRLKIPISRRANEVISKYKKSLPTYSGNQVAQFNSSLRELCKRAKINSLILIEKKIAGERVESYEPKHDMVSSHTARRTFCTLKLLAGMPAQAIMKFSGHSTERSFMKYLRLDNELVVKRYKSYFN